ncbi:Mediator of DNA damage checkpoint protein 1 [Physocladia obscura]|uniref:Mediator of DNA damage checkpoint protein 1 n=1 Tax=Physocladia obscura TaxID=109957 RepID=A0AAD5XHT8_9FUNG|nr:Mediator of DNA damage checkpoint protein 1 [Physocladia obscura]
MVKRIVDSASEDEDEAEIKVGRSSRTAAAIIASSLDESETHSESQQELIRGSPMHQSDKTNVSNINNDNDYSDSDDGDEEQKYEQHQQFLAQQKSDAAKYAIDAIVVQTRELHNADSDLDRPIARLSVLSSGKGDEAVAVPVYAGLSLVGQKSHDVAPRHQCVVLALPGVSAAHALLEVFEVSTESISDTPSSSSDIPPRHNLAFVEDLYATNETFINTVSLRPRKAYQLLHGDRVAFGPITCVFEWLDQHYFPARFHLDKTTCTDDLIQSSGAIKIDSNSRKNINQQFDVGCDPFLVPISKDTPSSSTRFSRSLPNQVASDTTPRSTFTPTQVITTPFREDTQQIRNPFSTNSPSPRIHASFTTPVPANRSIGAAGQIAPTLLFDSRHIDEDDDNRDESILLTASAAQKLKTSVGIIGWQNEETQFIGDFDLTEPDEEETAPVVPLENMKSNSFVEGVNNANVQTRPNQVEYIQPTMRMPAYNEDENSENDVDRNINENGSNNGNANFAPTLLVMSLEQLVNSAEGTGTKVEDQNNNGDTPTEIRNNYSDIAATLLVDADSMDSEEEEILNGVKNVIDEDANLPTNSIIQENLTISAKAIILESESENDAEINKQHFSNSVSEKASSIMGPSANRSLDTTGKRNEGSDSGASLQQNGIQNADTLFVPNNLINEKNIDFQNDDDDAKNNEKKFDTSEEDSQAPLLGNVEPTLLVGIDGNESDITEDDNFEDTPVFISTPIIATAKKKSISEPFEPKQPLCAEANKSDDEYPASPQSDSPNLLDSVKKAEPKLKKATTKLIVTVAKELPVATGRSKRQAANQANSKIQAVRKNESIPLTETPSKEHVALLKFRVDETPANIDISSEILPSLKGSKRGGSKATAMSVSLKPHRRRISDSPSPVLDFPDSFQSTPAPPGRTKNPKLPKDMQSVMKLSDPQFHPPFESPIFQPDGPNGLESQMEDATCLSGNVLEPLPPPLNITMPAKPLTRQTVVKKYVSKRGSKTKKSAPLSLDSEKSAFENLDNSQPAAFSSSSSLTELSASTAFPPKQENNSITIGIAAEVESSNGTVSISNPDTDGGDTLFGFSDSSGIKGKVTAASTVRRGRKSAVIAVSNPGNDGGIAVLEAVTTPAAALVKKEPAAKGKRKSTNGFPVVELDDIVIPTTAGSSVHNSDLPTSKRRKTAALKNIEADEKVTETENTHHSTAAFNRTISMDSDTSRRSKKTQSPRGNLMANAYRIALTGMDDTSPWEKIVCDLGGVVVDSWDKSTHLVTDKVRRTVKFLSAMAAGKHINSLKWLEQCQKAGIFVDESKHIIDDRDSEEKFGFKLRESIKTSREAGPFLSGFTIYATRSVMPTRVQMAEIVKAAGGNFVESVSKGCRDMEKFVVIGCMDDIAECSGLAAEGYNVQTNEFLLTGCLRQKIDLESHRLLISESIPELSRSVHRKKKK